MTPLLTIVAWALALALFQILLTAAFRTRETGLKYNASARDEPAPPPGKITARLQRAEKNLLETLPVFVGAALLVHVAGLETPGLVFAAQLYLAARILYIPLYALGVPYLRSLVWAVSLYGILQLIQAAL